MPSHMYMKPVEENMDHFKTANLLAIALGIFIIAAMTVGIVAIVQHHDPKCFTHTEAIYGTDGEQRSEKVVERCYPKGVKVIKQ